MLLFGIQNNLTKQKTCLFHLSLFHTQINHRPNDILAIFINVDAAGNYMAWPKMKVQSQTVENNDIFLYLISILMVGE